MKKIYKNLIFILAVIVLTIPLSAMADNPSFPGFPMAFYGAVNINGNPAPVGTIVEAYYPNSVLAGQITVGNEGFYGDNSSMGQKLIVSEGTGAITFEYVLPNTMTALTGITPIQYMAGFTAGTTKNENLNFGTSQSCVITNGTGTQSWDGTSWGDCTIVNCNGGYTQSGNTCTAVSSGGGGGGGGGGSITTPAVITNTNSAWDSINVGIADLSIMMSEWGGTGSSLSSDLNHDGSVDILDFSMLMANWNQ